jgi:hypothetical protein
MSRELVHDLPLARNRVLRQAINLPQFPLHLPHFKVVSIFLCEIFKEGQIQAYLAYWVGPPV